MEKTFQEQLAERTKLDEADKRVILTKNQARYMRTGLGSVDVGTFSQLLGHLQACIRSYDSCTKFDADGKPFYEAKTFLERLKGESNEQT